MIELNAELLKSPTGAAAIAAIASITSFVAGFITSRVSMSRFERKSIEQKHYENSVALKKQHEDLYAKYTDALRAYVKKEVPDAEDFYTVAVAGDAYFGHVISEAQAILGGNVPDRHRPNYIEACRRCVEETIPGHFEALAGIAAKVGFAWDRPMRRSDYQDIFDVVEAYGNLSPLPIVEASKA